MKDGAESRKNEQGETEEEREGREDRGELKRASSQRPPLMTEDMPTQHQETTLGRHARRGGPNPEVTPGSQILNAVPPPVSEEW